MSELVYLDGALYHSEDMSDEFLAHYGVKGMKWGRRKLREKNNKAWDRHERELNRAGLVYDNQVAKLKNLKGYGKIDRKTYKQQKNKALEKLASRENEITRKYVETVKKNKMERKNAIRANKQAFRADVKKRRSEPGKQYRKLINADYNAARANGASRTQALLNTYTGNISRELIYNR